MNTQGPPRTWATEDIAEGIRMVRLAKQGHPEYRFNTANARKYANGAGVDFNDLMGRCPDYAKALFHQMVIEEGVAQHFNVLYAHTPNENPVKVQLPHDESGEARTMEVRPWHYYREYCPKQWGNSFRGLAYVNDEELPYESVILEYIFSKIRSAWERLIMVGRVDCGDAFDGLETLVKGRFTGPSMAIEPSEDNAVAEFEKLLSTVPRHLYANVLEDPLLWFVPTQHLEWYVQNYRQSFQALPYNNRFQPFGPDSALKRATFVPTVHFTDTHIITETNNLWLGVGTNMEIDVQFHDAGKEQYLFVRVQGHTGVGYVKPENIILGIS